MTNHPMSLIRFSALAALIALCGCGHKQHHATPPTVTLQQVVLHGTVTSNDQATVLVDGVPATITAGTWSSTVSITSKPQDVDVVEQTNGIPVAERIITVR